ncbi:MAG: SpoIIE family protein phosphatase [Gammaproteobacteria bacterium]|nr:SpoIIE family protein phosphatase [Gammaproteobacteria bacterium]
MSGTLAEAAPVRMHVEQSVKSESGQVLLRSKLRAVSRRMGFSQVARERMELVCNEMVTNQMKFAKGSGLVQVWETQLPQPALDIFALDYGPGIPDLDRALRDGFTTANTLGKGLGAIRRLAHESEIYSVPDANTDDLPWHGTAVWARFHTTEPRHAAPRLPLYGACLRAYQDSLFNGDALAVTSDRAQTRWLHVDGLGHGQEAAEAVRGAGQILHESASLETQMQNLDRRLAAGGRGAVGLLCEADHAQNTLSFMGVGDMSAYLICNGERRSIAFSPGILGHDHRSPHVESLPFPVQALFLTCSDGLRRNWTLRSFPGLWRLHPQLIAFVLAQVTSRGNDDRSLFVIRTAPN